MTETRNQSTWEEIFKKHKELLCSDKTVLEECISLKARLIEEGKPCLCGNKHLSPPDCPFVCDYMIGSVYRLQLKKATQNAKAEHLSNLGLQKDSNS